MGLERVTAGGLQELLEVVEQRKSSEGQLYVLFCGSIRPETGESWCSDCVKGSHPLVKPDFTDQNVRVDKVRGLSFYDDMITVFYP